MFKQRKSGEIVIKRSGDGFTGVPMVVQLVGNREKLSGGLCNNPECKEWEMFNVYNPENNRWEMWYSHIEECQMMDFTPENVSLEFGKCCGGKCKQTEMAIDDIDDIPLGKVVFYQAYDQDGEIEGLLATTLQPKHIEELEKQWEDNYHSLLEKDEDPDPSIYGFIEFLVEKGYPAKRVFCKAEIITL
jgi:hypothetical protein